MPWKDLGTKDRWQLVASALQAVATVGTFCVAVVGIWKVTPIITYQVQQQEAQAERATRTIVPPVVGETVTDRFAGDAVSWWAAQVASYQRILDVTGPTAPRASKVSFQVIVGGATTIAPGVTPDMLVVTVTGAGGKIESIKVAANEHAMSPAQYLQCRVNQGVFAELDATKRTAVEVAVQRYIHRHMVPRVPPVNVQPDMSLKQLHDEISLHQGQRVQALQHLLGLRDMLDGVMRE